MFLHKPETKTEMKKRKNNKQKKTPKKQTKTTKKTDWKYQKGK